MANEQNLVPFTSDQDREEAKKNGQKGGVASGKARRLKRSMRELLIECLENENNKGVPYEVLATMGLIKGAVKGNAQNYKTIAEMIGEMQSENNDTPQLKIEIVDNKLKIEGNNEDSK